MIRFGIVGAGKIAQNHSDAIKLSPDCTLTAVADVNAEKAEAMAIDHGAAAYTDYTDIDCSGIDAVILNLPHFLHCEATVYFLQKGVHVLCEKPMAMTVEECDRMIEASKISGKLLAIGHVQKYYSAVEEVKNIVAEKRFGDLTMICETRCADYLAGRPKWFLDKRASGGGIAMNLGAHSIDRILYTTGLSVKEVFAHTSNPLSDDNVELNAQIFLKLSGGVSASISLGGTHIPAMHESAYYFTNGVLKIIGAELFVYENGKFVSHGGDRNLIQKQLEEFVKLIRGEKSAVCTPEYGREIIRILKEFI